MHYSDLKTAQRNDFERFTNIAQTLLVNDPEFGSKIALCDLIVDY